MEIYNIIWCMFEIMKLSTVISIQMWRHYDYKDAERACASAICPQFLVMNTSHSSCLPIRNSFLNMTRMAWFTYRLNTENRGFTPDKSQGPKAPRDLTGVKPTRYLTDLKHDQRGIVKEIPRDRIYLFSWRLRDYIYSPGDYIYI